MLGAMKIFLAILIALTASCVQSEQRVFTVDELLIDPISHNQKVVRVCGLLSDNVEYCGLESDVPRFKGFIDSRGEKVYEVGQWIWVNAGHDMCMPGKNQPMGGVPSESWAIIDGTFMTGGKYGHLNGAKHQIVASKIDLKKQSCLPEHGT